MASLFPCVVRMPHEMIKPARETPSHTLYLSEVDLFEQFHMQTVSIYKAEEVNKPRISPAKVLKEALAKVLVHYYPLAGRLKEVDDDGTQEVVCNAEGVVFAEAEALCTLQDVCFLNHPYLPLVDSPLFMHLDVAPPTQETAFMTIQVTSFQCGGFAVGILWSHIIMDGEGFSQFMKTYAEIARGDTMCPSVVPVWERERLRPRQPPQYMQKLVEECVPIEAFIEHIMARPPLSSFALEFPKTFTERLKESIVMESNGNLSYCTTFEALAALIWRAYAQGGTSTSALHFWMNTRRVLELPEGFYGNATTDMAVEQGHLFRELKNSDVAYSIRRAKEAVTEERLRSWIDFQSEEGRHKRLISQVTIRDNLSFNDWRHFEWVPDFGVGKGLGVVLPLSNSMPCHSSAILLPNGRDATVTRVLVALPRDSMPAFQAHMANAMRENGDCLTKMH